MAYRSATRMGWKVLTICIVWVFGLAVTENGDKDCSLIACYNNGIAVNQGGVCVCYCPPPFAGLLCEYELLPSSWPDGPYAIFMPKSGCPESTQHGWRSGYINLIMDTGLDIVKEHTDALGETKMVSVRDNDTALLGPFENYSLQLNFCFKQMSETSRKGSSWFGGRYGIFGTANGCPTGFIDDSFTLQLPRVSRWWSDGYLPHVEVMDIANGTSLTATYCHHIGMGETSNLDLNSTFILPKKYQDDCSAAIEGYEVEEETLTIYEKGLNTPNNLQHGDLSFCVYTPALPEYLSSAWPRGPYSLLMTSPVGCPESDQHGWSTGHIIFSTVDAVVESFYPPVERSTVDPQSGANANEMDAVFSFQIMFCYKHGVGSAVSGIKWPEGRYTIFSGDFRCPEGFSEENFTLALPPVREWSTEGRLPWFQVHVPNLTGPTVLVIKACRRQSTTGFDWNITDEVAFTQPAGSPCDMTSDDHGVRNATLVIVKTGNQSTEKAHHGTVTVCTYNKISACPEHHERCGDLCYTKHAFCMNFNLPCDDDDKSCELACYDDEFRCDSDCWPWSYLCDGFIHCSDGYDELDINCFGRKNGTACSKYDFQCRGGECLYNEWVCDGVNDCPGGEDEAIENCDLRCVKTPYLFSCGDGTCVHNANVCNHVNNCLDGRDEGPEECGPERQDWFEGNIDDGVTDESDMKAACDQTNSLCLDDGIRFSKHTASVKCQRELGLTDGSIDDAQLFVSSMTPGHEASMARRYRAGWCPRDDDVSPFLQIDLLAVSIISSITLYNRVEFSGRLEKNVYISEAITRGSQLFSVSYATFDLDFKNYSLTTFGIDTSAKTDIPQYVPFLEPFLARYIRIHPLEAVNGGILCLQLELRGCTGQDKQGSQPISLAPGRHIEATSVIVTDRTEITSRGFPRSYPSNSEFRWHIIAPAGYIRLTFTVIDLYSNTSSARRLACKEDAITLVDTAFPPLTARHNGLTPTFPTDKRSLVLTFVTCNSVYQPGVNRRGFRLVAKIEDRLTLWDQIKNSDVRAGELMSSSLLGIWFDLPQTQIWVMRSYTLGGPLKLAFSYFNVPCRTDLHLTIDFENDSYTERYCNTGRKPSGPIIGWQLKLTFYNFESITRFQPEGFSASFEVQSLQRTHLSLISEQRDTPAAGPDDLGVIEVCSKELMKCYRYIPGSCPVTWRAGAVTCDTMGYTLPVIHYRAELEFLQSWLTDLVYQFYTSGMARNYLRTTDYDARYYWFPSYRRLFLNIGLIRYNGINGSSELWQDGTVETFTAWGGGEPRDTHKNRCTGMWLNITTSKASWETVDCDEPLPIECSPLGRIQHFIFPSVCERPYNKPGLNESESTVAVTRDDQAGSFDVAVAETRLFRCGHPPHQDNTTEWVSRLAVCDGIDDCSDGSDEADCPDRDPDLDPDTATDSCAEDQFSCIPGSCIHIAKVCDFHRDCLNGHDEECEYGECAFNEFKCDNRQCIPRDLKCDAFDDCIDGSDETRCEQCSPGAFACGDMTCIPNSLVCNNVADCNHGVDELDCDTSFDTCRQYWLGGFSTDTTILHEDYNLGCQFQLTNRNSTLRITSVVDRKLSWRKYTWMWNETFINFDFREYEMHGAACTMHMTRTCAPYLAEVAHGGNLANNDDSLSFCTPQDAVIWWNETESGFDCDDSYIEFPGGGYYSTEGCSFFVVLVPEHRNVSAVKLVTLSPVVCVEEYVYSQGDFHCDDGFIVPSSKRCVYELNESGAIDGCRNYKHLEDCGMFTCPTGYAKCPSSFCIPQGYICDGQRQCPSGEDEAHCWCKPSTHHLVIVFNGALDDSAITNLFKFARQLHSTNATLYAVRVDRHLTLPDKRLLKKFPIHPFHEQLNLNTIEEVISDYWKVESTILSLFEKNDTLLENNVTMSIIDFYNNALFTVFYNDSSVEHLYNVTVDELVCGRWFGCVLHGQRGTTNDWSVLGSIGSKLFTSLCSEISRPCVGQFRCSSSKICIPMDQLCDGKVQCPFRDDETFCDFYCPHICACNLYVANCTSSNFTENDLTDIAASTRILDISHNDVFFDGVLSFSNDTFPVLVKLFLSNCSVISIKDRAFSHVANLLLLDLSFNQIKAISQDSFNGLRRIEVLNLHGNKYLQSIEPYSFQTLSFITILSLTKTMLSVIRSNTFVGLTLELLDISDNGIREIEALSFNNLSAKVIKFDFNPVKEFDSNIFVGLQNIKTIRAPEFKFCCFKPNYLSEESCWPHQDEFSSCEDLMRNSILQTLLWILGVTSLLGNGSTLLFRISYARETLKKGYGLFVTNLALSDFLMGIYLIIIAVADLTFRKRHYASTISRTNLRGQSLLYTGNPIYLSLGVSAVYMLMDDYWRSSVWCTLAGVLGTVSSEASVLFMCLITIDRFLVIKYPFGKVKLAERASKMAISACWALSWFLALLPLVATGYFKGEFYSANAVCLAMPLTQRRQAGWLYSVLVYVLFNFVAFALIGFGQFMIYAEIKKSTRSLKSVRSSIRNDISIAKKLLLVLATDFLCWVPIGVMALMAYSGHVIPGEVYAWTVAMVLPINSALNPYLYTLSAILEKRANKKHRTDADSGKRVGEKCNKAPVHPIASKKKARRLGKKRTAYQGWYELPPRELGPQMATFVTKVVASSMHGLHIAGLVYGGVKTEMTKTGGVRAYIPVPRKADKPKEASADIKELGLAVQKMLAVMEQ